ncbi:MAG: ECF transporter S component [Oscillospiraceae bacterium]|nr:ECF transporter S component [Oscillospiraceae bacterium]
MQKTKWNTKQLVILGLLTALTMIFSFTPIGSIPVGPLVITLNVIPIALAAVAAGPIGGLVIGSVFGLLSFLQCFGIGVPSGMGAILADINPFLAFVQRFVPRALDGFLVGLIFKGVSKLTNSYVACAVTGFFSAFLNTALFMTALVVLYGNTEYVQGLMGGKNILVFICTFVGINAVCEMLAATIVTGAVGAALCKAKLIPSVSKAKTQQA